jgi:hypothetical protein
MNHQSPSPHPGIPLFRDGLAIDCHPDILQGKPLAGAGGRDRNWSHSTGASSSNTAASTGQSFPRPV